MRRTDIPTSWNGWAQHVWFGLDYAGWTVPALTSDVVNMSAFGVVPVLPLTTQGDPSSPFPNELVMSYWIGLQDEAGVSAFRSSMLASVL